MADESKIFHQRLRRHKGNAKNHSCVKCGKSAFEWAYQHTDSDPKTDSMGCLYSTDPAHYAPMCRSCHRKLDLENSPRLQDSWRSSRVEISGEIQSWGGKAAPHPGRAFSHEEAVELGRKGGTARSNRMKEDPALLERMKTVARRNAKTANSIVRVCECGVRSTPAGIGNHQKSSGHVGTRKG